jgi:hypothetical protein
MMAPSSSDSPSRSVCLLVAVIFALSSLLTKKEM